jgi:A/G-specific adenine glycosylase
VAQGLPYFNKFLEAFPTVYDLASADEEVVLKLWQGLGYYSRARNLHQTAQKIAFEHDGKFPDTYAELKKLKGIGDYTAAAIASFSFNEVVPVVDGNVFRVLARYFDMSTDISTGSAKKEFFELSQKLISVSVPALYNQAIMEFGALQCVPKNPNCLDCILNEKCLALQKRKVSELPVKRKKGDVKNRYFQYLIFEDAQQQTLIQKRTQKDIWHNLYEFPLIESENMLDFEVLKELVFKKFETLKPKSLHSYENNVIVHKLSHQKLHIQFYHCTISEHISEGVPLNSLINFPFPIVIYNFIEKYSF